jgi:hypothetical protein
VEIILAIYKAAELGQAGHALPLTSDPKLKSRAAAKS